MSDNKHQNYATLNLIGYGLAKFDMEFVQLMGFRTKQSFFEYIVELGVAETVGVVKNRQDLFDPFFDNKRKGWWQKGDAYIHRKVFIDSIFGDLDKEKYARIVDLKLRSEFHTGIEQNVEPVLRSMFKQLQHTGLEAESYFIHEYRCIDCFQDGVLTDARLFGDGYDFQIQVRSQFYLAEVKGVRHETGAIRLTEREFEKAREFKDEFALAVVSNLDDIPSMTAVFNPLETIELTKRETTNTRCEYYSGVIAW